MGAQCNDPHVPHGQRPQEWGPPQCKYYGSVKHDDPSALNHQDKRHLVNKYKHRNTYDWNPRGALWVYHNLILVLNGDHFNYRN